MIVNRRFRRAQGVRLLPASLPEVVGREPLTLTKAVGHTSTQIGQCESAYAVAAEGRAQKREQRLVLIDRKQLSGAKRPALRREIERKGFDLTQERLRHGRILRLGAPAPLFDRRQARAG